MNSKQNKQSQSRPGTVEFCRKFLKNPKDPKYPNYRMTDAQQYAQCVLEMSIKWQVLRRAQLASEQLKLEIEHLQRKAEELMAQEMFLLV